MRGITLLIVLPFLLAECGSLEEEAEPSRRQPMQLPDPVDSVRPEPSASPGLNDAGPVSSVLALEGGGLRVFDSSSGSARPVPFGFPAGETVEILTHLQSMPPLEEGVSPDCGVEYATWESGLTARFSEDRFVGWSVREGSRDLTTASGVGIGSTRAEVEEVYKIEVDSTTIGVEFTAGDLAGLLDSAQNDGKVVALWSGVACIAR